MNFLDQMTPLHDRILVKHLARKPQLIELVQENPHMVHFVGQGENGEMDDNRRMFIVSRVISVGSSIRDIKKGDTIAHTAWNDLPDWMDAPKDYAVIREADVAGHCEAEALGYQA